jgi:hypothetical protein
MISCDPKSLSQSAHGFKRIPKQMLGAVKTFLLCQFANAGGTPPAPAAPFNPDISDASLNGSEIVTWSQASAPTSNEVWRSVNGGVFALRGTVAGALTTFTDVGVMAAGDVWTYKIRAVTGGVPSAFTTTVSISDQLFFAGTPEVTLSFPDLIVALDGFKVMFMPNLLTISTPKLRTANGIDGLQWQNNVVLNSVDVSSLVQCLNGSYMAVSSNPLLTSFSAPKLVVIDAGLYVNDGGIATVSIPLLKTIGEQCATQNAPLTSFSAPELISIGLVFPGTGNYAGGGCTAMTLLSLPKLQTVTNNFDCVGCTALANVSLGSLVTVGGNINVDQATIVSLTLTSLVTVGFSFGTQDCTALQNVSVPNWVITDGTTINLLNNALSAASIEQIFSRGVFSVVMTCTFDVSGGTSAGLASLSAQGQADYGTLVVNGNAVAINP